MKLKLFILSAGLFNIILISLFFFSSCGFVGSGGSTKFFEDSQSSDANPGDGDTPRLSSRLEEDSDLGDEPCEDNNRCEEACRDIYEDVDSYKDCYRFNIEKVSRIEDAFYTLLDAKMKELEYIEEEDLETYINTGLDGWRDKVISKQTENSAEKTDLTEPEERRKDLYVKLDTTLKWIIQQAPKVVPILEEQDRDNEILEKIILEYCNIDSSYHCRGDLNHRLSNSNPYDCNGGTINFDRDKNKELFVALSFVADEFFGVAMGSRLYSTFALGHELVEKACINRNSDSTQQCIDSFYRFIRTPIINNSSNNIVNQAAFDEDIDRIEEKIGTEVVKNKDCP